MTKAAKSFVWNIPAVIKVESDVLDSSQIFQAITKLLELQISHLRAWYVKNEFHCCFYWFNFLDGTFGFIMRFHRWKLKLPGAGFDFFFWCSESKRILLGFPASLCLYFFFGGIDGDDNLALHFLKNILLSLFFWKITLSPFWFLNCFWEKIIWTQDFWIVGKSFWAAKWMKTKFWNNLVEVMRAQIEREKVKYCSFVCKWKLEPKTSAS